MLGYVLGETDYPIDINAPIDISATVDTYTPVPTFPTPPTLVPSGMNPPAAIQAVMQAQAAQQYQQAQAGAFRQGFAPPATAGQYLQSNATFIYVGLGVLGLVLLSSRGRR